MTIITTAVADIVTIQSPSASVEATRLPDTAAEAFNLLTTADGFVSGPEAEVSTTDRPSGGVSVSSWRLSGRKFTVGGVWFGRNPRTARAVADTLRSMGADGAELTVTRRTETGVRWATVVLDGEPKLSATVDPGSCRIMWEFPLVSERATLWGADRSTQCRTIPDGAGLVWPLFQGGVLDWGSAAAGTGALHNLGTAPMYPTVSLTGNSGSGVAVGDGLGNEVVYRGEITAAPTVLDFEAGTARVGGADRSSLLYTRRWWTVPPGGEVTPQVRALQPSTQVVASFTAYDTYY